MISCGSAATAICVAIVSVRFATGGADWVILLETLAILTILWATLAVSMYDEQEERRKNAKKNICTKP